MTNVAILRDPKPIARSPARQKVVANYPQITHVGNDEGSITKLTSGMFRAQVTRGGVRKSKSYSTRKTVKEWAARVRIAWKR